LNDTPMNIFYPKKQVTVDVPVAGEERWAMDVKLGA